KLLDGLAIGIDHRRGHALIGVVPAGHDADKAGLCLLANEFGIGPIVEIAKRSHDRGAPWHTPLLHAVAFEEMDNTVSRNAHRREAARQRNRDVARMIREEPISDTTAERIVFDPADGAAAVGAAVDL